MYFYGCLSFQRIGSGVLELINYHAIHLINYYLQGNSFDILLFAMQST